MSPCQYLFSLTDVTWSISIGHNWCFQVDALRQWLKWSCLCPHDISYACKPWLMLHVVCRRRISPANGSWNIHTFLIHVCLPLQNTHAIIRRLFLDLHMPWQMHVVLGVCCLSLSYILNHCVQAIDDADRSYLIQQTIFRGYEWLRQTILDIGRLICAG